MIPVSQTVLKVVQGEREDAALLQLTVKRSSVERRALPAELEGIGKQAV